MIFRDIILDYDTYLQSNDKNNYTNRVSIKIKY